MLRTLPMTAWDRSWESCDRGRVFISLEGSADKADILKRIGNVLKGSDSPALQTGRSEDAFIDVLSDWFEERWDENLRVYILGGRAAQNLGRRGIDELQELFALAACRAADERARRVDGSQGGGEVATRISVVMAVDI